MLSLVREYAEEVIAGTSDDSSLVGLIVMKVEHHFIELRVSGDLKDYLITVTNGGMRLKQRETFFVFRLYTNSSVSFKLLRTGETFSLTVGEIINTRSVDLMFVGPQTFNFMRSELLPVSY